MTDTAPALVDSPLVPRTILVAPPPPARRPGYGRGFWGMVTLIATEATLFLALIATYFFLRASAPAWPLGGIEPPELGARAWIFTGLLLGSSIPIFFADAAITRNRLGVVKTSLFISAVMGTAFLVNTIFEFRELHFGWDTNAYGSIYYVTVGLHATHVAVGLLISAVVQYKVWRGLLDAEHHTSLEVYSLYWHFVDAVWIFVFATFFISPHIT